MIEILIKKNDEYIGLELDQAQIFSSFTLTLKDTDVEDPTSIFTNYSKTFSLPATKYNIKLFNYINDVQVIISGKKKYDCIIKNNGFLLDKGFINIDEYEKSGFKCTFYSDLNLLFDKLRYNEDGTNRLLSDLYYGFWKQKKDGSYIQLDKGTEQSSFYVWNADYITKSWDILTDEEKYNDAPQKTIYKNITAAPVYTGYYNDFDNKSCLMYDAKDNTQLNSMFQLPQKYGAWSIFEYPRDMEQFECRDFRANQQNVAIKTELLLDAISDPENNGGVNIYWDETFNDKNSKYYKYYHDSWMIGGKLAEAENTTLYGNNLTPYPKAEGVVYEYSPYSLSWSTKFDTVYSTEQESTITDISNIINPYITLRLAPDLIEPNTYKNTAFNNKLIFNGMVPLEGGSQNGGTSWKGARKIMGGFYTTVTITDAELDDSIIFEDNYFITTGPVVENYDNYMYYLRAGANKVYSDSFTRTPKELALKTADLPKSKIITCEYIWNDEKRGYVRSGGRNIDIPSSVLEGHSKIKINVTLEIFNISQRQYFVDWVSPIYDIDNLFYSCFVNPDLPISNTGELYASYKVIVNANHNYGSTSENTIRTLGRVTFCDNTDVDIFNQVLPAVEGADTSQDVYDKVNLFNTFKYSPLDILLSFTKILGLKFVQELNGVHIYTRENYYTKKAIDINDLVDISAGININYNTYQSKQYIYNYEKNDNYVEYLYDKKMKHDVNIVSITTDAVGQESNNVFDKLLYTNCLLYKLKSPYFNTQSMDNNPLLSGVHVVYNKRDDDGKEEKKYHVHPKGYYTKSEDRYGNICLFDKDVKDISIKGLLFAFIDGVEEYNGTGTPWIVSDNLRVMQQLIGDNCHLMVPSNMDQIVSSEVGEGVAIDYKIKTVKSIPHFSPYSTAEGVMCNTLLNNLDVNITGINDDMNMSKSIFELFHKAEADELYSPEQRELTCNVLLKNVDNINNLPRDFYIYKNCYWRIQEIKELKLDHNVTIAKITFLKVIDFDNY